MGKRLILCQKENKVINEVNSVGKDDNIYPAFLMANQIPVEEKYRFRDIKNIAKNKCPSCGGNLFFKYEHG